MPYLPEAHLKALIAAAKTQAEEVESGVNEGLFEDSQDNRDTVSGVGQALAYLESAKAGPATAEALANPDAYLERFPADHRDTAGRAYDDGHADGVQSADETFQPFVKAAVDLRALVADLQPGDLSDADNMAALEAAKTAFDDALGDLAAGGFRVVIVPGASTKEAPALLPFTVVFYIDGDRAMETFVQEVMAPSVNEAFDLAVEKAKEDGGTSSGHSLHDDDYENATEIDVFSGHGLTAYRKR